MWMVLTPTSTPSPLPASPLKGEEMMLRSIARGVGSLFAIYDVQHLGKTVVFLFPPLQGEG
jgi:hypothetical protein